MRKVIRKVLKNKKKPAPAPAPKLRGNSAALVNRDKLWSAFKLAKVRGALLQVKYIAQGYGLSAESRQLDTLINELALKIGSLGLPGEAAADSFKAQIQALEGVRDARAALVNA